METAFAELLEAVKATPGATIITADVEERYIYAEMREGNAVDDVEWLLSTVAELKSTYVGVTRACVRRDARCVSSVPT